ncbi:MAG: hypothetical protein R2697_11655 [Ilumatobacteraceae bacterium]
MSTVTLTKHHGLGNDFLVVFHPPVPEAQLPDLARRLRVTDVAASAPTDFWSPRPRKGSQPGWCSTTPTAAAPR